ncbi:hypothetical protein [Azospirillum griseum]|nr:hypothetical protein [Azospirillum griseum]
MVATLATGNDRSRRVVERLGMRFVGEGRYEGEPCLVYEARPAGTDR